MDNAGTRLVELLLGDPHGMEGGERGVDRTTEPAGVLALVILYDLRAMVRRHQGVHLAPETLGNVGEEGATAGEEDVLEEVTPDCLVALHNRIVNVLLDALRVNVFALRQPWLEQDLRAAEPLLAQDNLLAIG